MKQSLIFLIIFLNFGTAHANNDADWILRKKTSDIQVYTAESENISGDKTKVTATVDLPLQELYDFMVNPENCPLWIDRCISSEPIETPDDSSYVRIKINMPAVTKDRDLITKIETIEKTEDKVIWELTADPYAFPADEKFVRIQHSSSRWELTKIDKATTSITYYTEFDPGPGIPPFLSRLTTVDNPFNTVSNLVRLERNNR